MEEALRTRARKGFGTNSSSWGRWCSESHSQQTPMILPPESDGSPLRNGQARMQKQTRHGYPKPDTQQANSRSTTVVRRKETVDQVS